MKNNSTALIFSFLIISFISGSAQDSSEYVNEIMAYQMEQNHEFADSLKSPLKEEDRKVFSHLNFFPINSAYRIEAKFVRTKGEKPFKMATTTKREPMYVKYGEAHFQIEGKDQVLVIYKSLRLAKVDAYKDYLFLPFKDHSNGIESYGGGRFIDLKIPQGDTIIIDFNRAYNPYCAYNSRYSCPIPPEENALEVAIPAGVKSFGDH